jgi:hypothetical protein
LERLKLQEALATHTTLPVEQAAHGASATAAATLPG